MGRKNKEPMLPYVFLGLVALLLLVNIRGVPPTVPPDDSPIIPPDVPYIPPTIPSGVTVYYENNLNQPSDLNNFWLTNSWLPFESHVRDYVLADLSTQFAHSPPYSCRTALLEPWRGYDYGKIGARVLIDDWNEYYAYSWHYFPSSYENREYVELVCAHKQNPRRPTEMHAWRFTVDEFPSRQIRIAKQNYADENGVRGWDSWRPTGVTLPVDRWFRTCVHVIKGGVGQGLIEFWIDDKVIFRKEGVETYITVNTPGYKGTSAEDDIRAYCPEWVNVHANYVRDTVTQKPLICYFDDVIITDKPLPLN